MNHRAMAAEYLQTHYARFFDAMTQLLTSPNYVTKRQSVKLLGELLVDRANYTVMMQYVSDEQNLKLVMNLLRDRSRNIQLEAFHIFKVFVANPKKTHAVESILRRNRDRLLAFLSDFHNEREDESFVDEKQYVMQIIGCVDPWAQAVLTPAPCDPTMHGNIAHILRSRLGPVRLVAHELGRVANRKCNPQPQPDRARGAGDAHHLRLLLARHHGGARDRLHL